MATSTWEASDPSAWRDMVSLAKPRVTAMVVMSMGGGLALSGASLSLTNAVGLLLGIVFLVASANTLNCYLERESDAWMERTRRRPLPSHRLPPATALWFGGALLVVAVPLLAACSNTLVLVMGLAAHGLYVGAYTPMKRRSAWSLMVGAVPGALPPWMGWVVTRGEVDLQGGVLFLMLLLWQVPHTLAIGVYRQQEYRAARLCVVPLVLTPVTVQALLVASAMALCGVSLLPGLLGMAGHTYVALALTGGTAFVARCVWVGNLTRDQHARQVFRATLLHLVLLMLAMALDHA